MLRLRELWFGQYMFGKLARFERIAAVQTSTHRDVRIVDGLNMYGPVFLGRTSKRIVSKEDSS